MRPFIRKYDDPVLKEVCKPVGDNEDVSQLIENMQKALSLTDYGVGLAASQIGVLKRVILVKRSPMINPEIVWYSGMMKTDNEGCLSYPDLYVPVERHFAVKCDYIDQTGKKHKEIMFQDFEARILQHEIDHLNGICLVGDAWRKAHTDDKSSS